MKLLREPLNEDLIDWTHLGLGSLGGNETGILQSLEGLNKS